MKHQDKQLEEVNKTIAVTVKMLDEQLVKGIKITKLQGKLHEIIENFERHLLKAIISLRTQDFEKDFNAIRENVDEIGELYEKLDQKCSDWKQKFKKHNIKNYTLTNQCEIATPAPKTFYVDPFGYIGATMLIPILQRNVDNFSTKICCIG